ncbi:MAG: hypothetical protein SF052_07680 [Bacteroidia bacterium]|nr:hypothetical protein [Bacteroidia bacterium]
MVKKTAKLYLSLHKGEYACKYAVMWRFIVWIPVVILLLNTGCNSPGKGANSPEARSELDLLSSSDTYVGNKYLRMAEKIALLLEEAAAIETDQAAMTHIRDFAADNAFALDALTDEFDKWQKNIDDEEKMFFVMKLRAQPFSAKLRNLVPAFRNRIAYDKTFLAEYDALTGRLEIRR